MAPSFDCAISSLLCGEEDYSIFCDEFDYEIEPSNLNQKSDGDDSLSDLPVQSDECLDLMVKGECEQLPNGDYLNRLKNGVLDLGARMEAVDWIWKVHAYFNFGPLCAYLAVSYLDRFLSAYELPKGKAWTMQLLAVACLSVAAKMEETEVPLCVDLQVGESKFVFEARTIQKMELLVLSTLKWRMQAITPFSFIDYFLNKINGDKVLPRSSIYQSTQLILSIIKGIDYLKFRPSEVAAAVAVYVTGETQKTEPEKTISLLSQHVEKEKVLKCVDLINKQSLMCWPIKGSSAAIPFLPPSPIGVLDAACLSYKTDDKAVGSCTNSSHNSPQSKRRKLNMSSEVENIEGMWCGE